VRKHRDKPQYFKGKKLQSKIFNQLNIKKVKLTKIILGKKTKKKEKGKKKCKKKSKKKKKR
jgi:hypothetical protein